MAGYLGWYSGRGRGKGALNHIYFFANNIADTTSSLGQAIPGLTAQLAIRHMIEHVMNHEFFHLINESTVFRLAERLGKNPGRLYNNYTKNHREANSHGTEILRMEEAAANAFAFASHSIHLTDEQQSGFRSWLRKDGIGYGEFEQCLDENGVTPQRIKAIMELVFGKDSPLDAYEVYLEECESLQPLFRDVSLLIDPVDPEETDYAPHVFRVGANRSIPDAFYPITLAWVEENLARDIERLDVPELRDYFRELRHSSQQPKGDLLGSVVVHPVGNGPYIALMMEDESRKGWIALNLFNETDLQHFVHNQGNEIV